MDGVWLLLAFNFGLLVLRLIKLSGLCRLYWIGWICLVFGMDSYSFGYFGCGIFDLSLIGLMFFSVELFCSCLLLLLVFVFFGLWLVVRLCWLGFR